MALIRVCDECKVQIEDRAPFYRHYDYLQLVREGYPLRSRATRPTRYYCIPCGEKHGR